MHVDNNEQECMLRISVMGTSIDSCGHDKANLGLLDVEGCMALFDDCLNWRDGFSGVYGAIQ